MKASMYFNYTSCSLLRGGQHTILAIFCVAVGVMAIVSLQLVGFMLQNSLTSNVRALNGGDIAVTAQNAPLSTSNLSFFDQLKSQGTIANYTAITQEQGALSTTSSSSLYFNINAVDPTQYPLVSAPTFVNPSSGKIADLLKNNQVIVSQKFLDRYAKKVGESFTVYIKDNTGAGRLLHVTLAGVIANSGGFAQAGNLLLISAQDYQAAASASVVTYNLITVTTIDAPHADSAATAIKHQFPLTTTQTVADVTKTQQTSLTVINNFLAIAGLLALLIGGVGIINTMQVQLSRRKMEIATLKTTGYRRFDLVLLFGLEASMLGLIGGVIGAAAATGISAIVRHIMEGLDFNIPFLLNPWTIVGGIAIGFASALIFGLMPIVQAANIRPLNVIRESVEHRSIGSVLLSVTLLVIFSILFCSFAIVILNNNVLLGIETTYGTFAFLIVLGLLLSVVVLVISKLPVPEHLDPTSIALIVVGIIASVLLYIVLPGFGILLFVVVVLGALITLSSSSWKVITKMALRNIGRRRARTTTTIVALLVGLFTIGVIVALGQDVTVQIRQVANQSQYNVMVATSGKDSTTLNTHLRTIPGLAKSRQDTFVPTLPFAFNGVPLLQMHLTDKNVQNVISYLASIEGYNLATTQPSVTIAQGRNLNATDSGSSNVVIDDQLTSAGPFQMHLKPGDTITFASADGKTQKIVTVVGIYTSEINFDHAGSVLAANEVANALSPLKAGASTLTYMKIDEAQINHALDTLGELIPNASVQNTADILDTVAQQLTSFLDILVAIASLSVIAGVIIIANSVALAMLERRRELGILKAVGYTSNTILREVLIENGIIGAVGAFIAMLLAAGGVAFLGQQVFKFPLSISPWLVIVLVISATLLAMLMAALIAWGAVRVRPLEVLRYE